MTVQPKIYFGLAPDSPGGVAGWYWHIPRDEWAGPFQNESEAIIDADDFMVERAKAEERYENIREGQP